MEKKIDEEDCQVDGVSGSFNSCFSLEPSFCLLPTNKCVFLVFLIKTHLRYLPDSKSVFRSEVVIYVVERQTNGSTRRILATELYAFLSQDNIKVRSLTLCAVYISICSFWPSVKICISKIQHILSWYIIALFDSKCV